MHLPLARDRVNGFALDDVPGSSPSWSGQIKFPMQRKPVLKSKSMLPIATVPRRWLFGWLLSWLVGVLLVPGFGLLAGPPFRNSIVSTDIDFIRSDDPTIAFEVLDRGRARKEMPDKRSDELILDDVYVFDLVFEDGARVEVWADPEFESRADAEAYVSMIGAALGKLPAELRDPLSHVILHIGDEVAFAEELGNFFVLYSANMDKRVRQHDLEETIFHETIHATLEAEHASNPRWLNAQRADPGFITEYAASQPLKEDLPESALFAYTLIRHPGRLPTELEQTIRQSMPRRLQYLTELFQPEIFEPPATPLPSPISHWKFDQEADIALDSVGAHHGKIVGAELVDGYVGKCREFTRKNRDHVVVDYSDKFAVSTFTISAWVYLTRAPTFSGIVGTRHGGDFTFDMKVNASKVHGDIGDGKKWIETAVNFYADDTGSNGQGGDLELNRWYHIVFVIDGKNGECRLYLDADLKKTILFKGTPVLMTPDNKMHIGHSSGTEFMDGRIDEVKIWNVALTTDQVLLERVSAAGSAP